jgi:hypothetical protein
MSKNYKKILARADRVRQWFEDEEVKGLFNQLEQDIFTLWSESASSQEDERERLYREMHGLRALKERIKKVISEGRAAEEEIKHGN